MQVLRDRMLSFYMVEMEGFLLQVLRDRMSTPRSPVGEVESCPVQVLRDRMDTLCYQVGVL